MCRTSLLDGTKEKQYNHLTEPARIKKAIFSLELEL
jgi:hypothetical protein